MEGRRQRSTVLEVEEDEAVKAVEKVLTGCVSKVIAKMRHSSAGASTSKPKPDLDSEDEFQIPPPKKPKGPMARRKSVYPSAFLASRKGSTSSARKSRGKEKVTTYDRDIVCLPKSFAEGGSLIDIPKKNSTRQFLARNKLMGKIHLDSSMSQQEIFSEIRSSFRYPMNDYDEFRFRLLQPSGGEARCLMIPEVSSRYEWTAATVAGRNLMDKSSDSSDEEDLNSGTTTEPSINTHPVRLPPKKKPTKNYGSNSYDWRYNATYTDYVNLVSSDEETSPEPPPSPTFSPLTPPDKSGGLSALDLLKQQRVKELAVDNNTYQRVIVRRKHIWQDSLKAFQRKLDFSQYIRITFVGEPAIDEGGPIREFLHLLMQAIANHNDLFRGKDYNRLPCPNVFALQKDTYKYVGQMIAVSLIHGGPAPSFLAPSAVEYITYGLQKVKGRPEDVPDDVIQSKLIKLQSADCVQEVRDLLDSDEYDFRFDVGMSCLPANFSLADRDRLVQSLSIHHCIVIIKAQLDQIISGLEVLGVYQLIKANPNAMFHLLHTIPSPLTATNVLDVFEETRFSEGGSVKREDEEQIMMYWVQLLHEIEESDQPLELCDKNGMKYMFKCQLETVLCFTTGAPRPPPCGLIPSATICFTHNEEYPMANTCANTLYLPVLKPLPTYEIFCYNMVFGMLNSAGFQRV